ncbi:regulatory protein RecX [Seonamhaeicola maritimus]|uniref:Regulatory protein RecX n=1 Tax=Seonamhaeicola maritimus TaxID=2591822 RepID=A0A5C7GHF3_9FLAO|nr:regulatory protein RecX [Seonamhaeicola maritimus]TXG37017.1 RecX family transcriptional regulator [Seonamhaeicola maritimus]
MVKKQTYTLDEAKKNLEHYCVYQERCHKEVKQKLQKMNMIPEAIDVIIVHLIKHNFLNEERFTKAFVRGKFNIKKWGKYRLTLELKKKDISKANINQAINEIEDENYYKTFNDLAEKHFLTLTDKNKFKKKKKLVDYLLYRGWESHLVYEKASELIE